MQWLGKLFHTQAADGADYAEIRLEHERKRFRFSPADGTVASCDLSFACGGNFPAEAITKLTPQQTELCLAAVTKALPSLPLSKELDTLPPGAHHESLLVLIDKKQRKRYYSNTHVSKSGFSLAFDPTPQSFIELYEAFKSCGSAAAPCAENVNAPAEELWEETCWICGKCKTPNLMSNTYCSKCGEQRGW